MAKPKFGVFSYSDAVRIAELTRRLSPKSGREFAPRGRKQLTRRQVVLLDLTKVGGSDGTSTAAATWTYSVTNSMSGLEIISSANAIDVTASPHKCQRPSIGSVGVATTGIGYYDNTGALVVHSFNEMPGPGACNPPV